MSAPQPVNPNWQQIQKIQQQNQVFQQALASGKISRAQYNAAMNEQSRQLTELQKQYSPSPSPGSAPTPQPTPKPGPTPQPKPTPSDAANISNIVGKVPTAITQNPDLNQASLTTNQKDQPLETPRQVGVVFTTGRITQAEIDAYSARGKVLVPDNLKLPRGAKVTGSRIENGEIYVSYKTTEALELEQQLNLDASKWKQAGFSEYAGKAFFPDLAEYGEGAYLGRSEAGEPAIFTPAPQADSTGLNNIDTLNSIDAARLLNIRAAYQPVQEYYKQVAIKTAEFNALPAETKISEVQRMMPDAFKDVSSDLFVKDVTYDGGELLFTTGIKPEAVTAKAQEFNRLPLGTRISEVRRLMPAAFEGLPRNQPITELTFTNGGLQIALGKSTTDPKQPLSGSIFRAQGEPDYEVNIPDKYKDYTITGITRKEMVGPIQPGQIRASYLEFTFASPEVSAPSTGGGFVALPEEAQLLRNLSSGRSPASGLLGEIGVKPVDIGLTGTRSELEVGYYDGQLMTRGMAAIQADPVGYATKSIAQNVAVFSFGALPKLAIAGAAVNVGVTSTLDYALDQKTPTVASITESAFIGAAFAATGAGVFSAVSKGFPAGAKIVGSVFGRTAINIGIGAGAGYVLSGGDPQAALEGAAFAGLFSLGVELVAVPLISETRTRLPTKVPGAAQSIGLTETTIGKAGTSVEVYTSKPIETLGQRNLRIVADVTENPVGTRGVTTRSLIKEYSGQMVPTAHATLSPQSFNLKVGGATVLQGFPSEGAGFRASQQLYHFYSAPGSPSSVTAYGGYMGIGRTYGETPKLSIGGRATLLTTLETEISPQFQKMPAESMDTYLTRTSRLAGQTGIAQETLLGASAERQFVTTAQYERFGEMLVGSTYTVKGKVGTFQIRQLPAGRISEIPVLRTMLSKYTTVDVYVGEYGPASASISGMSSRSVNVSEYAKIMSRGVLSIPSGSVASAKVFPSTFSFRESKDQPTDSLSMFSSDVSVASYLSQPMGSSFSVPISISRPSQFSRTVSGSSIAIGASTSKTASSSSVEKELLKISSMGASSLNLSSGSLSFGQSEVSKQTSELEQSVSVSNSQLSKQSLQIYEFSDKSSFKLALSHGRDSTSLFGDVDKKQRKGKVRSAIWEFDIMEGRQVLELGLDNGVRSNGKRKGRKGLLELF